MAHIDVMVVGAGFAGLCMGIKLREAGMEDFVILERGADVGGTWRDNRYPGCACDVQSHLYSFSFEKNPDWTHMFAPQPEIQAYLQRCAAKYGLMSKVRLNTSVTSAAFDEEKALWRVTTADGSHWTCRVLITAVGGLSTPSIPDIPGLQAFEGKVFHSAQWDHGLDLKGKRVAVVGTGASAIQFVPQIAPTVGHLDLYQRTPPWIMRRPDRAISSWERAMFRALPFTQELFRTGLYWFLEGRVLGFSVNPAWMKVAEKAARKHLHAQVEDPVLRARLTPNYRAGCKRILISNDYYPALQRPNVDVLTDGVAHVDARGVVDGKGVHRPADAIIMGTGFTPQNPVPRGMLLGRGGRDLWDGWSKGAEAYKGTTVSGFPNLFFLVGPNTGLGHTSIVVMIEAQVAYVMEALKEMKYRGWRWVDVKAGAQRTFNEKLQKDLERTIWNQGGCQSWYLNESGRNTTLWPTFTFRFRAITAEFDVDAYDSSPA
jgi:cation diffusion facilitator CzcD-associated flavoprotein CzcO